jgi:asparagine synthase (glutamine-hydrolysing)
MLRLDDAPADEKLVTAMTETLIHRGPDQGRVLVDGPCALGNRRLAILDLSPAGALPMRTADNALAVAYNGEIYNYPELKRSLEAVGVNFRSGSDAEALLELYRREGPGALNRLRGMFAFALWDGPRRRLLLARDRLGEKPLYYYADERILVFASEIKALLAHPAVPRESALDDPRILALYLGHGYLPAPLTAFKHIKALPPGHLIDVNGSHISPVAYWTPPRPADAQERVTAADIERHREAVRAALEESVRQCLLSDVPLGAFLSGGLDSSLIVALMRRHSNGPVKTFSIGFTGDASFSETAYAQQVAAFLGTEHTAFIVEPEALQLVPTLVWHHDQPFGDSSAIPTLLISRLTRQHVTVALTGDGGDELFAGYERFYAAALMRRLRAIPRFVWKVAIRLLNAAPEGTGYYNLIKRARRFARGASLPAALAYFDLVRLFSAEATAALVTVDQPDGAGEHFAGIFPNGAQSRADTADLLLANMRTYLPGDLLIKTDRSSMAASLEARAPFLDHRLVELAAAIPANLKLNGSVTKYILKQAARGLIPDAIIDRPKHGFGVPLGAWLRTDITPVRDVLLSHEARQRGLLNPTAVAQMIDEHASGRRDHGQRLWALLTLEWWHRLFIDPARVVKP